MKKETAGTWNIHVDVGGTFTDCIAETPGGEVIRSKVLSHGCLACTVMELVDACSFRIAASWCAPDDFLNGFADDQDLSNYID